MTKKSVILILAIFTVITVLVMSFFGRNAVITTDVLVDNIALYDMNGNQVTLEDDSSSKSIHNGMITLNRQEDELTYYFKVAVLPQDAKRANEITERIVSGANYSTLTKISKNDFYSLINKEAVEEEGNNYHYYKIAFSDSKECKLEFKTNKIDGIQTLVLSIHWDGYADEDDQPLL